MHAQVAEFLGKLSALMEEYDAEIMADQDHENMWSMTVATKESGLDCMIESGCVNTITISKCLQEATHATP